MQLKYRAVVYPPPLTDYPFLAAIVDTDWTIVAIKPFASEREARAYLAKTLRRVSAMLAGLSKASL